ncbi:MAG: YfhO family protein [Isosphaeraceae bacterium]|nr:YfhO family protein [Isosphaeraceae bacterium]
MLIVAAVHAAIVFPIFLDHDAIVADAEKVAVDANARGPRSPGNDLTRLFLPMRVDRMLVSDRLGRTPGWDERGFLGRPLVGNSQASLNYPPLLLLGFDRSPAALGRLTAIHLVWLGIGGVVLARSLGMGAAGSTIAGIIISANPYVLAQFAEGHLPHIWTVAWFPSIIAFLVRARPIDALLAAAAIALSFLAGHVQEWWYLQTTAFAVLAVHAIRGRPEARSRLLCGLAAWATAAGLIAIELLPSLAALESTPRGESGGGSTAAGYALSPLHWLQLVDASRLGGPWDHRGPGNHWETLLSIGLPGFLAVLASLADGSTRRDHRGWIVALAVALWFAAGPGRGLYDLLASTIPMLGAFRVPARCLFLAAIPAGVLAGWAVDRPVSRTASLASTSACLLLLTISWILDSPSSADPGRTASALIACLAGGVALRAMSCRWTRAGRSIAWVWVAWVAVDAIDAGRSTLPISRMDDWIRPEAIAAAEAIREDARLLGRDPRVRADDLRFDDLHAAIAGIAKVNVGDSFQLERSARLYRRLYRIFDPGADDVLPDDSRPSDALLDELARKLLDITGVTHLAAGPKLPGLLEGLPVIGGFGDGDRRITVLRNPSALPRAFVVGRARSPSNSPRPVEDLLALDPRSEVLLAADPLPPGRRARFRAAEIEADRVDSRRIRLDLEAPGFLVTTDAWAPGWTATINGSTVSTVAGNVGLLVVPIARSGSTVIELEYHPPMLGVGRWITALAACVWMFALIRVGRRRVLRRSIVRYSS